MKILFLDIDGVLNSEDWMLTQPKSTNFVRALDKQAVALLAEIVSRTEAKIVVSSSWRKMYDVTVLCQVLVEAGFPAPCPIIGVTPALYRTPEGEERVRGHEIQQWLDEAAKDETVEKVESFAIVDDDSDMAHLPHRFVQTNFKTGLQRDHVERIVALLASDDKLRCRRCCSEEVDMDIEALGHGVASFSVDCRTCGTTYAT